MEDKNINRFPPFFSIIIPIYNVEPYLKKCVDSILCQQFIDFEVVLVDDGSPDNCPLICDDYARRDSRIKVVHKKNGGLSSARNAGIRVSEGMYIIFIDSDDYWNSDLALKKIYAKLCKKNIEVLVYNNIDYSCRTHESVVCNRNYDSNFMEQSNKRDVLKYLFNNNLFPGAAWVTVTKRDFLLDKNLYFIEGIKAEDIDWLLNVFLSAKTYSALNEAFYVYLKYRTDSITGTADAKSIDDLLFTIKKWERTLQDEKYQFISDEVFSHLAWHYISALLIYNRIDKKQKKEYHSKLKKHKYLLKYRKDTLMRIISRMPIPVISWNLDLYKRAKMRK